MKTIKDLKEDPLFKQAEKAPVKVTGDDGNAFILMTENDFEDLKNEIESFKRRLASGSSVIQGKNTPFDPKSKRAKRLNKKAK